MAAVACGLAATVFADVVAPAGARRAQDPAVVCPGQAVSALSSQFEFALAALSDGTGPAWRDQPMRGSGGEEAGTVQGLSEDRTAVEEILQGLGGDLVPVGVPGCQGQAGDALQPPQPHRASPHLALVRHLLQFLGDRLKSGDVPVADAGRVGA